MSIIAATDQLSLGIFCIYSMVKRYSNDGTDPNDNSQHGSRVERICASNGI